MRIAAFVCMLGVCAPLVAAGAPKSLSETPLDQCTPQATLDWMDFASVERQSNIATESMHLNNQLLKIDNTLPKNNRPVIESMTPAQAAQFSQLTAQLMIHSLDNLAESRLQRDIHVIDQATVAIEKMQKGERELKTKDDPGGLGAGLVELLRFAGKSKQGDVSISDPTDKTCTLDLAMFMKEQQVVASGQKLAESKEAEEMKALIAQYHLTQLDPSKLPSPDREKAVWLNKAIGEPIKRDLEAINDWENLRRFARVSSARYSIQLDEIIASAGAKDYDYGTGFKKAYAESDEITKRMFVTWVIIDKNIPAEATKQNAEIVKIIQQSSGGPHK